jgi:hypothetical protein
MDSAALAATVVGLIAPYLLQLGHKVTATLTDRVAGQAADATQAMVERLYGALKARLRPGSYEANQLEGVEAKPASPVRQQALAGALAEYLDEHPDLAAELGELVAAARQAGACVQAIGSGITAGGDISLHASGGIIGRDRLGSNYVAQDRTIPGQTDS